MDRLYPINTPTPPGTPIAAPIVTPFPLEDAQLEKITIIIPDGHSGLTGIRILWSGTQIVPFALNYYLTGNDRVIEVKLNSYITVNALSIETYNLDIFAHTFWIEALVTDPPVSGQPSQAVAVDGSAPSITDSQSNDALDSQSILEETDTGGIATDSASDESDETIPPDISSGIPQGATADSLINVST
jgi:hypothetical protein